MNEEYNNTFVLVFSCVNKEYSNAKTTYNPCKFQRSLSTLNMCSKN